MPVSIKNQKHRLFVSQLLKISNMSIDYKKLFKELNSNKKLTRWQASLLLFLPQTKYIPDTKYQKIFFKIVQQWEYTPKWNTSDQIYHKKFKQTAVYQKLLKSFPKIFITLGLRLHRNTQIVGKGYFPNIFNITRNQQKLLLKYNSKAVYFNLINTLHSYFPKEIPKLYIKVYIDNHNETERKVLIKGLLKFKRAGGKIV